MYAVHTQLMAPADLVNKYQEKRKRIDDFLAETKALQPHEKTDLKGDFKKW